MKDKSIWATILNRKEDANYLIVCPFTKESGIKNTLKNDYDFTFFPYGSTETGEYEGGIITCSDIRFNLTQEWSVTLEYIYTGNLETNKTNYSKTHLAEDWNAIFCFGRHILDKDHVNDPQFILPLFDLENKVKKSGISMWCQAPNPQAWHRYCIEHKDNVTAVSIDNVPQDTQQFDYPKEVQGFFMSGGGYYHSLPCKIRNFTLYGTVVS